MNGILSGVKNLQPMTKASRWGWLPDNLFKLLLDIRSDVRNTLNNIIIPRRFGSRAKQVKKIKHIACGQCVYILATGPSIKDIDLRLLDGKIVIPVNAAISLLDSFNPAIAVHAMVDSNRIREIGSKRHPKINFYLRSLTTPESISPVRALMGNLLEVDDIYIKPVLKWQRGHKLPVLDRDDRLGALSYELSQGFYDTGNTVVFMAIQAALYMEPKEIVLCGVDMNFSSEANSNYGVYISGMHVAKVESFEHKINYMFESYREYMIELKKLGIVLSNASSQSKLVFLPKHSLS